MSMSRNVRKSVRLIMAVFWFCFKIKKWCWKTLVFSLVLVLSFFHIGTGTHHPHSILLNFNRIEKGDELIWVVKPSYLKLRNFSKYCCTFKIWMHFMHKCRWEVSKEFFSWSKVILLKKCAQAYYRLVKM